MSIYRIFFEDGTTVRIRANSPRHAWELCESIKPIKRIQWVR